MLSRRTCSLPVSISLLLINTIFLTLSGCGGSGDSFLSFPFWIPTDVIAMDIDRDGDTDILTVASKAKDMSVSEGELLVYFQTSSGLFAQPKTYNFGTYPWQLQAKDMNGDAWPDLVVTDVTEDAIWLLIQKSDGTAEFESPVKVTTNLKNNHVALADLNGDGATDIAFGSDISGSTGLGILYQNPGQLGVYMPALEIAMPGGLGNIVAGDIDSDSRTDLVMGLFPESPLLQPKLQLASSLQLLDGTLDQIQVLATYTGVNDYGLFFADYNGDGRIDLLSFLGACCQDFTDILSVMLQQTNSAQFTTPINTSLERSQGTSDAVFADLNGDAFPDAAVVSNSSSGSQLDIMIQTGNGAFAFDRSYEIGERVSRIAAADLNGDALNDLVLLDSENRSFVLMQSATFPGTFSLPREL